jgi:hypothetical protein
MEKNGDVKKASSSNSKNTHRRAEYEQLKNEAVRKAKEECNK